ncbi:MULTISPECIES: hypothetical protein [Bacillus]|uniref:hypothetical protein n=1 Tax=Bacillus TaxID=1386 RepID=UPI0004DB6382|nr:MULTISPECIES: hypothetical protein [Bacillus]KMN54713.1 hypothetical protein VK94_12670 [Bacillus sp. LK7]MDY7903192.1 hypothetical protein [Bacillus sp. AG1]QEQ55029.1 hypothetical protein FNS63_19830 [Bacillus amyloliquefaciens]QWK26429.1 hypothetical protein KM776_06390 [Bacillus velezensis]UQX47710.1 hypothetical protein M5J22_06020 [Bacillus velezensis]
MADLKECKHDELKSVKTDSPYKMVILKCKSCEKTISALEDIDMRKWNSNMYRNHQFFENQFNHLRREVDILRSELDKKNMLIIDLLERLNNRLR